MVCARRTLLEHFGWVKRENHSEAGEPRRLREVGLCSCAFSERRYSQEAAGQRSARQNAGLLAATGR